MLGPVLVNTLKPILGEGLAEGHCQNFTSKAHSRNYQSNATMSNPATFLGLPPELRTMIYEYVALSHSCREVHIEGKTFCTTTSALVATCRLISSEYADASWTAVTELCFNVKNLNFAPVLRFMRKLDKKHFAILQRSNTTISSELSFTRPHDGDVDKLGRWLAFCAKWCGETTYVGDYGYDDFCTDGVVEFLDAADPTGELWIIDEMIEAVEAAQSDHEDW